MPLIEGRIADDLNNLIDLFYKNRSELVDKALRFYIFADLSGLLDHSRTEKVRLQGRERLDEIKLNSTDAEWEKVKAMVFHLKALHDLLHPYQPRKTEKRGPKVEIS